MSGPIKKQLKVDWKTKDKSNELHNFEIEVRNIFLTYIYNIQENKMCQ